MRVRVRVPQLARGWIRGWVTQTVGDHPCLAFELERTDAGGRTRYAFLGGVTAIEVDVRGGGAMVAGGATDAGDWVAFPLDAARAQDTGCRRR
jgi:hypothetical protein